MALLFLYNFIMTYCGCRFTASHHSFLPRWAHVFHDACLQGEYYLAGPPPSTDAARSALVDALQVLNPTTSFVVAYDKVYPLKMSFARIDHLYPNTRWLTHVLPKVPSNAVPQYLHAANVFTLPIHEIRTTKRKYTRQSLKKRLRPGPACLNSWTKPSTPLAWP